MLKNLDKHKVRTLLEHSGKLKAIQYVIQATGISLHEAKDYVDNLSFATSKTEKNWHSSDSCPEENPDIGHISFLIGRGEKIKAIQYVKEQTGMDLREAKVYVENLSSSVCGVQRMSEDEKPIRDKLYRSNDAQNGLPLKKPKSSVENWSLRKRILVLCASVILPVLFMLLMVSLDRIFGIA